MEALELHEAVRKAVAVVLAFVSSSLSSSLFFACSSAAASGRQWLQADRAVPLGGVQVGDCLQGRLDQAAQHAELPGGGDLGEGGAHLREELGPPRVAEAPRRRQRRGDEEVVVAFALFFFALLLSSRVPLRALEHQLRAHEAGGAPGAPAREEQGADGRRGAGEHGEDRG